MLTFSKICSCFSSPLAEQCQAVHAVIRSCCSRLLSSGSQLAGERHSPRVSEPFVTDPVLGCDTHAKLLSVFLAPPFSLCT